MAIGNGTDRAGTLQLRQTRHPFQLQDQSQRDHNLFNIAVRIEQGGGKRRSVTALLHCYATKHATLSMVGTTLCTSSGTPLITSRSAFCSLPCFSRRRKFSRAVSHNRSDRSGDAVTTNSDNAQASAKPRTPATELRKTVLHGMYPQLWRAKNLVDSRDAAI